MRLLSIISRIGPSPDRAIPRRGSHWISLVVALCCGLAGLAFAQAPAPTAAPNLPQLDVNPAAGFSSVFINDIAYGKDPFFPKSTRPRRGGKVVIISDPDPIPPKGVVPWDLFELKGISISPAKRLALINNYTLAEGESRDYKFSPEQSYELECVTIKDRSVVVRVLGKTKELSLRAGL